MKFQRLSQSMGMPTSGHLSTGFKRPSDLGSEDSVSSQHMQPESLSKAIQLSVAPVFLLAGIGALMNVLSGRLARIVDNAKQLRITADAGGEVDEFERRLARRRMQLVIHSIELLTAATLLIAGMVATMFLSVISRVNLTLVVVPLFITSMVLVMLATVLFLREVRMASALLNRLI